MTTNLIVVKLRTRRARRHVDLCDHQNSLQLVKDNGYLKEIIIADFTVRLRLGSIGFRLSVYIYNNEVSRAHSSDKMINSYSLGSR